MNWLKRQGFDDWRFWAIFAFLVALMVITAVKKTDSHNPMVGDYPFINRNIG